MKAKPMKLTRIITAIAAALLGGGLFSATLPTAAIAAVPDSDGPTLNVKFERTDKLKDSSKEVKVGTTLTWKLHVTFRNAKGLTMFPRSSSLDNVAVKGDTGYCRWEDKANKGTHTYTCSGPQHTISANDFPPGNATGTFVPTVTFDITRDRDGRQKVKQGLKFEGTPVQIRNESVPPRGDMGKKPVGEGTLETGKPLTLMEPGDLGFKCHRIPALTVNNQGWVLAAWDGRPDNCNDAPQANSIVQRISKDGGNTFGPAKVIAQGKPYPTWEKYGYSDPSYVVDRQTGKIFMFFVKSYDVRFQDSRIGVDPNQRNVLHAAVMESNDGGENWSEPRVITADITRGLEYEIMSRFAASGEGIQIQRGRYAGRLVQQYTFKNTAGQYRAVSVYSDDHGQTWQRGELVGIGMDENKVVELSDGSLLLNSRRSNNGTNRYSAVSKDGGQTYGPVREEKSLIDPHNNAGLTRAFPQAVPNDPLSKILLFTNTRSTGGRSNGTVSVSMDDGKTWQAKRQYEPGDTSYSTITPLRDGSGKPIFGQYGVLYEWPNQSITFKKIDLKWLGLDIKEPAPQPAPKPEPAPKPQPRPNPHSGSGSSATPNHAPSGSGLPTPAAPPVAGETTVAPVQRLEGKSRIDTAVSISKHRWNKDNAKAIYLVAQNAQVDALSAGSLTDGPILYVSGAGITQSVVDEIARLGNPQVYAIGGDKVLSEATIKAHYPGFKRLSGADRFATAVQISRHTFPNGASQALIVDGLGADGQGSPDALVAGALSGLPVLLARPGMGVDQATAAELTRLGNPQLIQLGKGNLGIKATKIGGKDRFETAIVAARQFSKNPRTVVLARADLFTDATAVGTAKLGPILLTTPNRLHSQVCAYLKETKPQQVLMLGGNGALGQAVMDSARKCLAP